MAKELALYIEDTEVKLLLTSGNRVEKWAGALLDDGLIEQGNIQDVKRVAEVIAGLLKQQNVGLKKATVGLTGLSSISRILTLPEVPGNLLPEAISNEAARVLPVPLSQVYYAYQMLPSPRGELKLFLVAYARNAIDTLISAVTAAGLKIKSMDLAPLALARCAEAPRAVLVNSWLSQLDIVILNDRIPQVIRSISLPVEGVSMADKLPSIMEEIERTIAYYNSSNADKTLDKTTPLMICGDINREEAGLKALEKLGYPVSVLKPPLKYPESFNPSEYMVNAGLALKGKLPGGGQYSLINVDILPEAYKPPTFSWTRVLIPVGVVVALCILAYGVLLVNDIHDEETRIRSEYDMVNASLIRLRAEIKLLQDELAEKKAIAEALPPQSAALEAEIQALSDKIGFYQNLLAALQQGLDSAGTDFNAVVTRVAPGLLLTSMSCDGEVITLTGSAASQDLILEYARNLRDSALFQEVIVTSIQQVEPAEGADAAVVYQFQIDLK